MNQKENLDSYTCIITLDFAEIVSLFYKMKISHFIGITVNAALSHPLFIIKKCQMFLKKSHLILDQKI